MARIPSSDLPVVDPKTGRINLEWYAALQRITNEIAGIGSGGVTSFEGRTGVVVGVAGDYTAAEVTNAPAGSIAAATVQAALNELDAEKQPLNADLTALAALATTGLMVRTAAATYVTRAIAGTANEIAVANADGVAGAPTVSLPATIDLGGKTSLEIPNSAAPVVDADGEIAVDTTVTDFSHGILKYFGGEELGVVAMPIAQFTAPTDGHVVTYSAAADEFQLQAGGGGGGGGASTIVVQVFTASGTYTPTAGMDFCIVEGQASGGGGGGADGFGADGGSGITAGVASGGGGAGEYRRALFDAAAIGGSQAVTVNASGAAGSNTGGNGGNGGNGGATVFGALLTANGGTGGTGTGSNSTSSAPVAGGAGGTGGSGGSFSAPGGNGAYGYIGTQNPVAAAEKVKIPGRGGDAVLGKGAEGVAAMGATDSAGVTGGNYGGGGSGATDDDTAGGAGGAGGPGIIVITEFILGNSGVVGPQGKRGFTGEIGADGDDGQIGPPGRRGVTGAIGARGPRGFTITGPEGEQGDTGDRIPGRRGLTGPRGFRGPIGDPGDDGETVAIPGRRGATGATGATGGGGGGNVGTATLNFGSIPVDEASVVVTGQAGIVAGSRVHAIFMRDSTADFSVEEMEGMSVYCNLLCGEIVAATGFTIRANMLAGLATGSCTVYWSWN